MSSAAKLPQKLSSIAATWPKDPFRPNLQLKNFFQSLSNHPNLTPKAVDAVAELKGNVIMKKVRSTQEVQSRMELIYIAGC